MKTSALARHVATARKPKKAAEQLADEILGYIVEGGLAPGARLAPERQMLADTGRARGTLREALRFLEQEGLVVSDGRGHMSVRTHTAREVVEVYDVRIALETMAAILVSHSADREARVDGLREVLEPLKDEDVPLVTTIERDLAFHRRLCALSDNQILLDTWTHLLSRIRASIVAAGPVLAPGLATYRRHAAIVDAITDGDEGAIRGVLLEHMREAATRIARATEDGGEPAPA